MPLGVKRWSWGAFFFNWLWGIFNGTWIALLTLIPFVGWVMMFVLGAKGREWAWQNKQWGSYEEFERTQRKWSAWGVGLFLVSLVISVLGVVAAVALPAYQDYRKRAIEAQAEAQVSAEARRGTTVAPAVTQPVAEAPPTAQAETLTAAMPAILALPAPAQGSAAAAQPVDILAAASGCESSGSCLDVMLAAAEPRRPDILQAAAARVATFAPPAAADRKASRELNSHGLMKFSAKEYGEAAQLFMQAAIANPGDAEVKSNLGLSLLKVGRTQDSTRALIGSLEIDPRRSSAWAPLAEALATANQPDDAYAALLLTYEFSQNKQKTLDYFSARAADPETAAPMRAVFDRANKRVQAGY